MNNSIRIGLFSILQMRKQVIHSRTDLVQMTISIVGFLCCYIEAVL